eukprot:TRINITY_DN1253_c0_g1_i10.p1 TRINITY_DN1253_c0_g1~~TRINITY_DN1253_c0_g1_i10.p1  ORF type:complete len:330 (+),score=63.86 TRINITY_DN1253_c0_g1_i10:80-1069(+)
MLAQGISTGLAEPLLLDKPSTILTSSSEVDYSNVDLSFDPPKSPSLTTSSKITDDSPYDCPTGGQTQTHQVALNVGEPQEEERSNLHMARPDQVLQAVLWEIAATVSLILASRFINDKVSLDSVWHLHWTAHVVLFLCFVITASASLCPQYFSKPGTMFAVSISVVLGLSYILGLVCLFYDMQVAISASAGVVCLFYLTKLSFKFNIDFSRYTFASFMSMFIVIGLYVVAVLVLPRVGQEDWMNNIFSNSPVEPDSEFLSSFKRLLLGVGCVLVSAFVVCDSHSILKEYTTTEYLTAAMNVFVVHLGFFVFAFLFFDTRIPMLASSMHH